MSSGALNVLAVHAMVPKLSACFSDDKLSKRATHMYNLRLVGMFVVPSVLLNHIFLYRLIGLLARFNSPWALMIAYHCNRCVNSPCADSAPTSLNMYPCFNRTMKSVGCILPIIFGTPTGRLTSCAFPRLLSVVLPLSVNVTWLRFPSPKTELSCSSPLLAWLNPACVS